MWEQIAGHETVKQVLINALKSGKLAHAYLLTGPRGIGKETIARALAQAFFCAQEDGTPCNSCTSCQKIMAGNYADLHVIEQAGTAIKIEQVREIQKICQYKSYEGRGKAFIIKNAETMTPEGANCLLKVLEEPKGDTLFLLIAENPYALLQTVLSRCQRLNLQPLPVGTVTDWLIHQGFEEDKAKVAAFLSNGLPGKALELVDSDESGKRLEVARRVEGVMTGDLVRVLRIAEEMDNNKETILEELDLLALWYRDLLVWKTTREEGLLINIDMVAEISKQAAKVDAVILQENLANIMKTKSNLRANANLRLNLESLLLKLMKIA